MTGVVKRIALCALLAIMLFSVVGNSQPEYGSGPGMPRMAALSAAKSLILFIGDGMGPEMLTMATLYSEKVGKMDLNLVALANSGRLGLVTTYSNNKLVTDSAAGATAVATGSKTNNGMIGVAPDKTRLENLLEKAVRKGKSVGVITTTSVTDATPAAFLAHAGSRTEEAGIAGQIVAGDATVVLGGGKRYFVGGEPVDLIKEAHDKGFDVVFDKEGLRAREGNRLLGLFADDDMPNEGERVEYETPSLSEMFDVALRMLTGDPDGFVLVVEGGRIDHAEHDQSLGGALDEVIAMDVAVGHALEYQQSDSTLTIVVTADHDTGAPAFTSTEKGYPPVEDMEALMREGGFVKWLSGNHTSTMVPMFAHGPGEVLFSGIRDNTYINHAIVAVLGL